MRSLFFVCTLLLLIEHAGFSQKVTTEWGDETRMKLGGIGLDILNADETGVYVLEGGMRMKAFFVIGASYAATQRLIKFDRNFNQVYDQQYKELLKGLEFKGIQFLKTDMYLFAQNYSKREKTYTIYGMRLDRKNGVPIGAMKQLASFTLESKRDDFNFIFKPSADSTQWNLVTDIASKETYTVTINVFDRMLQQKSVTKIDLGVDPDDFDLEDVINTTDNKFLVIGKEYEYLTKKKKAKSRVFKDYLFSKYDLKGKKEFDLPTSVGDHFALSGKAIYFPNGELSLTGFYTDNPKKKEVDGVFLSKLDSKSGKLLSSSFKPVSESMLNQAMEDDDDDDDKESRKERKEREREEADADDDGLSKDFVIRGAEVNPKTGGMLIIAEMSTIRTTTTTSRNASGTYSSTTRITYTNSDLMVVNTDRSGNIEWIRTLPKRQVESLIRSTDSPSISFFTRDNGMPYYSSFSYLMQDNNLYFFLNDNVKNAEAVKAGDRVKTVFNFKKSSAYLVTLDLKTGNFSRELMFSNRDDLIPLPRFGLVLDRSIFMAATKRKNFAKPDLKVGKISVKS